MEKDFATRLDQVFHSVFNSKSTLLYENAKEDLSKLVKEACETHLIILAYNNGEWVTVKKLPINNCAIHPRSDGSFDFIHEGHVTTYGSNCRFAIG